MDFDSDVASLPSGGPRSARGGGRARRSGGGAATARPEQDSAALLALREECTHAKQRERAAEEKMRHLAAQLARTEEAAKRILTRTDPSARGGVAQRLLDAERELARAQAELAELGAALARSKQQAGDSKKQATELKSRLETALASQRHLALQLGRLQAGGGGSTGRVLASACRNAPRPPSGGGASKASQTGALAPGSAELVDGGSEAQADAAAARRFAAQQERLAATEEQLAAAQQRNMQLEQQLQQQRQVTAAQSQEVSSLRAQVARGCSLADDGEWGPHAVSAPERRTGNGSPPTGDLEGVSTHRSSSTDGGESSNVAWLRLQYLEARTALERSTASNTQLLRKLESSRVQVQQLHEELHHRRALEQEQGERSKQQEWGPFCHSAQQSVSQDGVASDPHSSSLEAAALPAGSAVGDVHHLRQQLAAANHRAACLEIELDAATAKLAVYQTQSSVQPEPQPQQLLWTERQQQQPQWQESEQHGQQLQLGSHRQQLQKHHQWQQLQSGSKPHSSSSQLALHVQTSTATGHSEDSRCGVMQAPTQRAASPAASKASGPGMMLELQLLSSEVDEGSTSGPLGFTFLTADIPSLMAIPAMTAIAEGPSPTFNTTLQFVLDGKTPSLADLGDSEARVDLHHCKSSSGAADYDTVATATVPLGPHVGFVEGQPQHCTLCSKDGSAVGRLWYVLSMRHAAS